MNDIGIGSKGIVLRKTPEIRKTSSASVHAEPSSWSSDTPARTSSTSTDVPYLGDSQTSSSRPDSQRRVSTKSKAPHSQSVINKRLRNPRSVPSNNHDDQDVSSNPSNTFNTSDKDKNVRAINQSSAKKEPEAHHITPSKRLTSTGSLQRIQNLYNVANPLDNMRRNSNQLSEDTEQTKEPHSNRSSTSRNASIYTSPQAAIGAIFSRLSGFFGRPAATPSDTDEQDDDLTDEEQEDGRKEGEDDETGDEAGEDQVNNVNGDMEDETDGSIKDEEDRRSEPAEADEDGQETGIDEDGDTDEHREDGEDNSQDESGDVLVNGHTTPVDDGASAVQSTPPEGQSTTPSLTTPGILSPTSETSLNNESPRNVRSRRTPLRLSPRRLPPIGNTGAPRNSLFDLMDQRRVPHRQDLDRATITLDDPVPLQPPDYSVYTFGMDADLDNPSTLTTFDFSVYRVRMDIDHDNPPPFGPSVPFASSEAMPDVPPLEIPEE